MFLVHIHVMFHYSGINEDNRVPPTLKVTSKVCEAAGGFPDLHPASQVAFLSFATEHAFKMPTSMSREF